MWRWTSRILSGALQIIGVGTIVKILMRHWYPQKRILERLLFSYDQTAPTIYINQYREAVDNIIEAVDNIIFTVRNFWPFGVSLSGMAMNVVVCARDCGAVVPKNSITKVHRRDGSAQIVFNALNLAAKDVTYIRQLGHENSVSCLTVQLTGNVHVGTFFDDFETGICVSANGIASLV